MVGYFGAGLGRTGAGVCVYLFYVLLQYNVAFLKPEKAVPAGNAVQEKEAQQEKKEGVEMTLVPSQWSNGDQRHPLDLRQCPWCGALPSEFNSKKEGNIHFECYSVVSRDKEFQSQHDHCRIMVLEADNKKLREQVEAICAGIALPGMQSPMHMGRGD